MISRRARRDIERTLRAYIQRHMSFTRAISQLIAAGVEKRRAARMLSK